MGNGKVILDWVCRLPWKQQSVLLSALRGPDAESIYVKMLSRWLRMCVQENADPTSGYMGDAELPEIQQVEDELMFLPTHYTIHLLYGLEITGYNHSDPRIAERALRYYTGIVARFHLVPESKEELDARLIDVQ